ncbi:hypothetical protein DRQ53_06695 [bacterium]|nr:MAG: hypothetical protein DRQ32_12185 [bacterium]RKZ16283.1 MAG: hypothetical protein DRQ53_06695 [bacterium]
MRKKWCKFTSLLFCLIITVSFGDAAAQLRISEVLSAPASDWDQDGLVDTKLDEWIEVTNLGAASVDLTDVYMRDGTGTAWHYGFSGSLAPGQTLLVTGTASVQWQAENDAGSSGLSLNNGGDHLELWRAPMGGVEVLLDAVDVPRHAGEDDRALAWLAGADRWILHDGLNPYGGELVPVGTGCEPSPGDANFCTSLVPVGASSVGQLKAVFDG